jgi:hypothetical protein
MNNAQERRKRNMFTREEDQMIIDFVYHRKKVNWLEIESIIKTRTARQCRERWKNSLSPILTKQLWTLEEDNLLKKLVEQQGQKWAILQQYFPGKTDVHIKNRYQLLNRHLKTGKK